MAWMPATAFLLLLPIAGRKESPPKKPEWPFTVFVRVSPADETQTNEELLKGSDELKKAIAKKKDWFRMVDGPERAEIVVDVVEHRLREQLTFWASTGTIGGETEGVTNSTISQYHSLRARVTLLGAEAELTGMNPKRAGSVKGASSALMKELVKLCQERYESLRDRRARPNERFDSHSSLSSFFRSVYNRSRVLTVNATSP
jgi:hypothetical protein